MNIIAVILNFFMPGIGSFFVGKGGAGVAQLLLYLTGLFLVFTVFLSWIGIFFLGIAWVWGLVTAATANNTQKVVVVRETEK